MSFISFSFILFLAGVLVIYYLTPPRRQWIVLLAASCAFLAFSGLETICFLLVTITSVYACTRAMQALKDRYGRKDKAVQRRCRRLMILAAVLNFGVLLALKYYDFAAENLNRLADALHAGTSLPLLEAALPLGISFYTFQAVGYTIDVYHGRVKAEKNYLRLALFLSFFPQLTQGPISRYAALQPALTEGRAFSPDNLTFGAKRMLWGFFKKLVIADRLGILVSTVFDSGASFDGLQIFAASFAYAIQIYTDFSGGIDIALGAAETLGIRLPENFRQPYFADTVSEYWRRWHMTLTGWMREYVFFPLTLSRFSNRLGKWGRKHLGKIGKQLPAYIPTAVTFLLIGVWHSAGWGFILYGLYNSVIIVASMMLTPAFKAWKKALRINDKSRGWKVFCVVRTFLIMMYGKVLTRAATIPDALSMIRRSFTLFAGSEQSVLVRLTSLGLGGRELIVLACAFALLVVNSALQEKGVPVREKLAEAPLAVRWTLCLLLIAAVLIFGAYGEGYDASDFVYRNY